MSRPAQADRLDSRVYIVTGGKAGARTPYMQPTIRKVPISLLLKLKVPFCVEEIHISSCDCKAEPSLTPQRPDRSVPAFLFAALQRRRGSHALRTRIALGPSGVFPTVSEPNTRFPEPAPVLAPGGLLRIA